MSNRPQVCPVTAVIVTYQSSKTIGRALAATKRCHDAKLLDVVVVDNNSTDATHDIVKRESAWVKFIPSKKNNGFGKGCNIGAAYASTPYIIFINPDAEVEPDAVKRMLEIMQQYPSVGIVGPAIIEGDKNGAQILQETGARPTPWTMLQREIPLLRSRNTSWAITPGSQPTRTGWVCGAVLMIRTDLFRKLGGFDPRFFLYWEETDLCKRAEDMRYEIWVTGTAVAHHIGGASSKPDDTQIDGCIAKHYLQSRFYYLRKHYGLITAVGLETSEFILLGLNLLADLVRGRGTKRLRARFQAPIFSEPEK